VIGDRNGEGGSLCNLGNAYNNLHDYAKAIEFYQKALPIQREAGNRQFEANSLGGLGDTYQSLSEYQKAIEFHQKSLEIRKEISDRKGEISSLIGLGNAYFSLKKYGKAIEFQLRHNEIARNTGDRNSEANSYWGLNNSYQQRGRLKLSMHYRHKAYCIWKDMNLPLADAPFPAWNKKLIQTMGDTWAEQLIASDKAMAWLMFPIGYLLFTLRILLFPLTQLQTRLKIQPKIFWFCVGITIVLLIAWLKK
jgi:tetratricopeptide (TPR) repeat protein